MADIIDKFLDRIETNDRTYYKEIAEKAIELGYKPKRDKVKHLGISFRSSKHNVTILRYIYDKRPEYRLKFFAAKVYSKIFDESIKWIIEKFNYRYVGCYGCGKCIKELEGYTVEYEDGRKYFRCGSELIEIKDMNERIKDEVIELMERQALYYERKEEVS